MFKKLIQKIKEFLDKLIDESVEELIGSQSIDNSQPTQSNTNQQAQPSTSSTIDLASTKYPLGLSSCWGGANASKRMMNILSPKMSDSTFKDRVKFMKDRNCTAAHVILVNGGDGEAGGYAGWKSSDKKKMLERLEAVRASGLVPIPWVITDDSDSLAKELFSNPKGKVAEMAEFFKGAPYVVLGLEMNEYGSSSNWSALRSAVKAVYNGPLATHHTSGNSFQYASLGDIIMGQLNPGCSTSDVKTQIKAIKAKGKRAVGFEYSRGPSYALAKAALDAGAEGVGNWDLSK